MVQRSVRRIVRRRAGNQCEYLALASYHCNRHKGPNIAGLDPDSGEVVPLFNPRWQKWSDHFQRISIRIIGLTPTGRATVNVLSMNAEDRLRLRANLEEPV